MKYEDFSSAAEQTRYFLRDTPAILPHAAEWLTTMLARTLNQDRTRQVLVSELVNNDPAVREPVVGLPRELAAEDSDRFAPKVAEVIE